MHNDSRTFAIFCEQHICIYVYRHALSLSCSFFVALTHTLPHTQAQGKEIEEVHTDARTLATFCEELTVREVALKHPLKLALQDVQLHVCVFVYSYILYAHVAIASMTHIASMPYTHVAILVYTCRYRQQVIARARDSGHELSVSWTKSRVLNRSTRVLNQALQHAHLQVWTYLYVSHALYVSVCMHIFMCVCVCIYMYVYIFINIHICICIQMYGW